MEVPPQDEPFVLQFRELLECMRTGREPECSMAYSRSVVAVVEAVYRSGEEGKEQDVDQENLS
ncbi:hypothetical protein N6H14_30200 [Paenibacillus sp. CC-CFT747]|nr:hypothetical protein N6H14_30200 [Paenibacillus sp. CC-CFT747]